jgi:hypothetical protein
MTACGSRPRAMAAAAAIPSRSSARAGASRACSPSRLDDDRLTWPERELVRQLGERLYGKRPETKEADDG